MQKKIALSAVLLAIIIGSFAQIHKDISVSQTDSLIAANSANPDFTVLDVRTFSEYSEGHIQHAIQIDYYSPTFGIQLDSMDKNDIYLVYCRSGARSARAIDTMRVLGFQETYNMQGGFSAWKSAGYQTVTSVEEVDDVSVRVEIYPNPASDFVTISMNRKSYSDVILNIYNITGSLVRTESFNRMPEQIDTGDLGNGIYMVEIRSNGLVDIQKLIIKR